jgi:hypothetical protein
MKQCIPVDDDRGVEEDATARPLMKMDFMVIEDSDSDEDDVNKCTQECCGNARVATRPNVARMPPRETPEVADVTLSAFCGDEVFSRQSIDELHAQANQYIVKIVAIGMIQNPVSRRVSRRNPRPRISYRMDGTKYEKVAVTVCVTFWHQACSDLFKMYPSL